MREISLLRGRAFVPLGPATNPLGDSRKHPSGSLATVVGDSLIAGAVGLEDGQGRSRRVASLVASEVGVESRGDSREAGKWRSVLGGAGKSVDEAAAVRVACGVDAGDIDAEVVLETLEEISGELQVANTRFGVTRALPREAVTSGEDSDHSRVDVRVGEARESLEMDGLLTPTMIRNQKRLPDGRVVVGGEVDMVETLATAALDTELAGLANEIMLRAAARSVTTLDGASLDLAGESQGSGCEREAGDDSHNESVLLLEVYGRGNLE